MRLYPSTKIYLDNSSIHGKGVFASQKILKDEIFEVTPYLDLEIPKKTPSTILMNHRYNWPQGKLDWEKQVVGCGFSSFYNHNNIPNSNWRSNLENDTFEFFALRDIEQDEEIFVYYGGEEYWNDGRTNVEVK